MSTSKLTIVPSATPAHPHDVLAMHLERIGTVADLMFELSQTERGVDQMRDGTLTAAMHMILEQVDGASEITLNLPGRAVAGGAA